MNIEHVGGGERRLVFPRMNAVYGTYIHARGVFRADARFTNNIRHRTYYYNRWTQMISVPLRAALLAAITLGGACSARAQTLPSEPVSLAGGRITLSGDVSASIAPTDEGFFNYTDYEHSALRLFRVDLSTKLTITPHVAVLGEIRDENIDTLRAYALYLRIRPWLDHAFDIQAGRIPPTFGAFSRRDYAADNPLIGYPLAYQYLTSLRADALPRNADELLAMRGRGWLASYSIGNTTPENGVPLASAFR